MTPAHTGNLILTGDGTSRCVRCGCVLGPIPLREWPTIAAVTALMEWAMTKHERCLP